MSGKDLESTDRATYKIKCLHCSFVLRRDKFSKHMSRKHEGLWNARKEESSRNLFNAREDEDFERVGSSIKKRSASGS